jgi:2-haloacid dehalogenase
MDKQNKNPSTAIVFDFGGVLMDWNPHYLFDGLFGGNSQAVDEFLRKIGFLEWNEDLDRGRSFAEGTAELMAHFPEHAEHIHAYDERYMESVRGCDQAVVDILRKLKNQGTPLYGLSNWSAEKFSQVRLAYPFFELFDDIVLSGDVHEIKPDKKMFNILLQRIGHSAGECVFIDDHSPNIAAAKELGFQTIHFKSAEQLEKELVDRGFLRL